jgi:UDP-glucose 4-epimerase
MGSQHDGPGHRHALLEAGEQAVVLDNLTTGLDWAAPAGATFIADDVGDQSRVALIAASNLVSQITSRTRSYRDS